MTASKPAYAAIGDRLTRARIAAGFTTSDAAAIALDVPREAYRSHETGNHRAKPDQMRRYADVFGVTFGWLSTGIGHGPR